MTEESKTGERIAKAIARAGVASRRDAEKMILAGRVAVNGKKVDSPALDVLSSDRVTVDGKPIDAPQPTRMWLYYKPVGLVTSARDEKGRQTVFDTLPEGMPRVMSVGRLDLTSEGLLILTNDGELKRRLELPSTGWLRKYRVRVNGRPSDQTFDPLRQGVTIDGEAFQPMEVTLDKQQGANAWLTVGLREGRNREIRRAMTEIGLIVNRLIRVSYGPFRLNTMKPGDVVEIRARVLREQLGGLIDDLAGMPPAPKSDGAARGRKRPDEERKPKDRHVGGRKPTAGRDDAKDGDRKPARAARSGDKPRGDGERPARPDRRGAASGDKPFRAGPKGDGPRKDGERSAGSKSDRGHGAKRDDGRGKPARRDDRAPRSSGPKERGGSEGRGPGPSGKAGGPGGKRGGPRPGAPRDGAGPRKGPPRKK